MLWWGGTTSLCAQNEMETIQKILTWTIERKILNTLYPIMLTSAWTIAVLVMQRVYKYIKKVKNMPDHKLPK